jgi:hypothetical protein
MVILRNPFTLSGRANSEPLNVFEGARAASWRTLEHPMLNERRGRASGRLFSTQHWSRE